MIISVLYSLFSDETVLLLIQDSIDELLLSLDVHQIDPSFIWPVLRTLANSCEIWRAQSKVSSPPHVSSDSCSDQLVEVNRMKEDPPSHVADHMTPGLEDSHTSHVTDHVTPEAIEEFFLQYHREKELREEHGDLDDLGDTGIGVEGDQGNEQGEEEEDPYNQSKQLSPLSHTVVEVMQRCAHHMSMEPPRLRLIVLETLTHCLRALQYEQVGLI